MSTAVKNEIDRKNAAGRQGSELQGSELQELNSKTLDFKTLNIKALNFKARIAGIFYLLTFVMGGIALFLRGRLGSAADVLAGICYIAVTLLFYDIFKPVSRSLSSLAAFVSLGGCAMGTLSAFQLAPFHINPLVLFGFYCLLIGSLIFRSGFLPRTLGVLMAFGGLGWLTFLSPPLAKYLYPYNMAPGILGEGALTVWLLVIGMKDDQ